MFLYYIYYFIYFVYLNTRLFLLCRAGVSVSISMSIYIIQMNMLNSSSIYLCNRMSCLILKMLMLFAVNYISIMLFRVRKWIYHILYVDFYLFYNFLLLGTILICLHTLLFCHKSMSIVSISFISGFSHSY